MSDCVCNECLKKVDQPHYTAVSLENSCWQWGKIHTDVVDQFISDTMNKMIEGYHKKEGYSNFQMEDEFNIKFVEVFEGLNAIIDDPFGNTKKQRGAWKDRVKLVKLINEFQKALDVDRDIAREKVFAAAYSEAEEAFHVAWRAEKARKWGLKHIDQERVKARSTVTTFMGGDSVEKARHAAMQKDMVRKEKQLQYEWDLLASTRQQRNAKGIMSGYKSKKKRKRC